MSELISIFKLPAGPEDMPQGMDFWVDFRVGVKGADQAALSGFAAGFEASAAPWAGSTYVFAVPRSRAEEFFAAALKQDWFDGIRLDDHQYSPGEYFDPAKPANERFLFGFAG